MGKWQEILMYKLIRDGQYKSKELKLVNDKSEWLKISTIITKKESTNRLSILLSAEKPIGFSPRLIKYLIQLGSSKLIAVRLTFLLANHY
jgi:hypothetical protein